VIAQLTTLNVPYKYTEGGGAIMVPAERVHDLRLRLASQGLPKGAVSGFEMMEANRFGMTQFQERLTFQRGLEGELSRSIGSLAAVESARVHLALPAQNGFFREQQKPSASVVLTLHAGRTLDSAQVAGIVHLVSSSVPEMNPKAVSVLDQTGALISSAPDSNPQAGLDAQQLQYVAQIEQGYAKRIAEMLEPVVGRENLRANVTASVDFSQIESTEEAFKPNQGADAGPATVRSQQTTEQNGSNTPGASGVPGAASNQPPVAATAPLSAASGTAASTATSALGANSRRDAAADAHRDDDLGR
jgi:flagellar M-ring protein FliF